MEPKRSSNLPGAANDARRQLLARFEDAWHNPGPPPRIDEFVKSLAANPPTSDAARRDFLEELVLIDLECRWRRETAAKGALGAHFPCVRPRLEDYVAHYLDLGALSRLGVDLISEEYRVRHRWGDRPSHAEYAARFVAQWINLHAALVEIDRELAAEFAIKGGGPRPARSSALGSSDPMSPASSIPSAAALVDQLRQHELLDAGQLSELANRLKKVSDPRTLAQELIKQGWLTPYQVNLLFQGRGGELVIGPYVLLQRLGEGGAGQVFKARHKKMDRLAALKVIRKELLSDAEVVARFYREMQVLSQLDHPNVVRAYDSGTAGAGHYLVMEYVEGSDLGQLVKQGGPMPVQQACAYMRQAALGLQHAHERGLVHRDIKPHNLIMSVRDGLVKVADLGLARLPRTGNTELTAALSGGNGTGTLTPPNAVLMGTADYLAPEQALDFHKADIRSDIYSLGCTFYYLLTGKPPFPSVTLTEKLLRHQQAEPPPLTGFRKDVPPELEQAVRKMLAKRPEDRFQSPAEIDGALASIHFSGGGNSSALVTGQPYGAPRRWRVLAARLFQAARAQARKRPRLALGGIAGVLLIAVLLIVLLRSPSGLDRLPGKPGEVVAVLGNAVQRRGGAVAFSPDGRFVACLGQKQGAADWVVCLWDAETGKERTAPVVRRDNFWLSFTADGKTLAYLSGGSAILWDIPSFQQRTNITDSARSGIASIDISPDGRVLAVGCASGAVELWDVPTGTLRTTHPKVTPPGWIQTIWFAPDGRTLALTSREGPVNLWSVTGSQERRATEWHWLTFAPKGQLAGVANTTGPIKLLDWADGKVVASIDSRDAWRYIAISSDAKLLADPSGETSLIRIWDISRPKEPKFSRDLSHLRVSFAAFVPQRMMLATLDNDPASDTLYVWDLRTGQMLLRKPKKGHRSLTMAADGRHMAVWGDETVEIIRLPVAD
jgi:tRNA A-37 threonylcarbamoyl transferase component Bud32